MCAAVQTNARWGGVQQAGNIEKFYHKLKTIVSTNDGKRDPRNQVAFCHDPQAPFDFGTKTQIDVVNTTFNITNIRKSFITAEVHFMFRLTGLNPAIAVGDVDHVGKLFVGWKYSGQAVRRLQLYNRTQMLTYQQEHTVQEAVAFSVVRPHTARDRKRFIHTLYENAVQYMPDICGVYINLADLADGTAKEYSFEINIPVVDFLALQCFNKWFDEFGSLMLELYFTAESMVVCTCNPQDVLEYKQYLQSDAITNPTFAGDFTKFTLEFTNVGKVFNTFTNIVSGAGADAGTATFTVGQCIASVDRAWMRQLTCTNRGFMITDRCRQAIRSIVGPEGLVIPGEYLDWHGFPDGPNVNGVQTSLNIPYENVAEAILVFPEGEGQYNTCYHNPMFEQLAMTIGQIKIPDQPYSTTGAIRSRTVHNSRP
jgi:hypothetical protein